MDPATMMMLFQALSSVAGGLTDQSGYKKVSNFDKTQQGLYNQMGRALGQGGGFQNAFGALQGYLDPNSQAYGDFEAPYRTQFNEQTLPMIAERFAGAGANSGALSSSGFGQALGGAGAQFESNLAGLKEQMRRASIGDILGQYQNFLGQKPYHYREQGPGALSSIFSSLGGMSNPFGAPKFGG